MCKREKIFAKMEELRRRNGKYDLMVLDIERAIEKFIAQKNKKNRKNYKVKFFILAIPFTEEERKVLEEYLTKRYISRVFGDYFSVKKFFFKELYRITSCR